MEDCHDHEKPKGPRKCLRELLDKSTSDQKFSTFDTGVIERLTELEGGVATLTGGYREKLRACDGFLDKWKSLDCRIKSREEKLKEKYPNCKEVLRKAVCEGVIEDIWEAWWCVDKRLGEPDRCLERAKAVEAMATAQLDAWATITEWITKRLADNEALLKEICDELNGTNPMMALYLFFFLLKPAHMKLKDPKFPDPAIEFCAGHCSKPPEFDGVQLCGMPWLIEPSKLDCKIADVLGAYIEAGHHRIKCECEVAKIAVCRERYTNLNTEESQKQKAADALQDLADQECSRKQSSQREDGDSDRAQY